MNLLQIHEPGETPLPHAGQAVAVGIDLGTTNSLVAVASDGRAEAIPGADGSVLVPSVVSYGGEGGMVAIVGAVARDLLGLRPETVVSSIKRLMGRGIEDMKRLAGDLPFSVEADASRGGMIRLRVAGRTLSPVEISADILREMKARAEHALGRAVEQAVITVPAYFDDAARSATKDAAKLAGLEVLRLVNEPTAAALAYGLDKGVEGLYAVYDLGGGTFDVSLLRLEKGVFQVLATGGDAALGGDDLDHVIAEHLLAERGEAEASVGLAGAQTALRVARALKEALSTSESATASLAVGGRTTQHTLGRATHDALVAPLVERTIAICTHVLADADVAPGDVNGVVLVGGSTRVPLVRRRVAECFSQMPLADIDPDAVVALGAALQAEALTAGSNTLLLDVTPLSLGIETMGGLVEKLIPRNTPIPVALAQEFTTYQDGQDAMVIHVVQGEREMVHQCRSLARFTLQGIPPMTAGAARVRVAFAVDADGLLTVSASEATSGARQEVAVKPSYGLAEGEIERMLRDSMVHARTDMEERLLAGARVEAERSLLALAAALGVDGDLLTATEVAAIEAGVAAVRKAIAGADRHAIDERVEALEKTTRDFAERRMDRGVRRALAGVELQRLERVLAPTATRADGPAGG